MSDSPIWKTSRSEKLNQLIAGTYFANKVCLVLYRDNTVKTIVFYRLTEREWLDEIVEDLQNLLDIGIYIESVTCDGLSNIIKAVKKVSPETVIQRCLAHILRETHIWLSVNTQSLAGLELRNIIRKMHLIKDRTDWGYLIVELTQWYQIHKGFVNHKTFKQDTNRYWLTHKSVRKAFIYLKLALPYMFSYLDNPRIQKTTSGLESFFGHLKQNISIHRWLSKEHCKNYIK